MPQRPTGIVIISLLHVLGGFARLALFFLALLPMPRPEGAPPIPSPGVLDFIGVALLGILPLASGFGLWAGRRWGWWSAGFFHAHSVFLCIVTAVRVWLSPAPESGTDPSQFDGIVLQVFWIVVHLYVLRYVTQDAATGFCGMTELRVRRALTILFGSAFGLVAILQMIALAVG